MPMSAKQSTAHFFEILNHFMRLFLRKTEILTKAAYAHEFLGTSVYHFLMETDIVVGQLFFTRNAVLHVT